MGVCVAGQESCYGQDELPERSNCLWCVCAQSNARASRPQLLLVPPVKLSGHANRTRLEFLSCCWDTTVPHLCNMAAFPVQTSSSQAFMICEPADMRDPHSPPAQQGQLGLTALHLPCPADWTTWFCTPSRRVKCWLSWTGSYPPWATLWQIWPTAQCPTAWHLGPWGWPASPILCRRVR